MDLNIDIIKIWSIFYYYIYIYKNLMKNYIIKTVIDHLKENNFP